MTEQESLALEEKTEEVKPVEVDPKELEDLRTANKQLETKLQIEMIEKARLEGAAKTQEPAAPAPTPRATREQLQAAVDSGQLTQTQMDTETDRWISEDMEAKLTKKFEENMALKDQEKTVKKQFDSYVAMRPDVKVEGSEDLRKVLEEVQALGQLGYPANDLRTEVLAMRAVFGPIERVPETTRLKREAHQETGGTGGGGGEASGSKWEKGLTQMQVGIYRSQLEKGIYKGDDDPFFLKVVTRARTNNVARKAS